MTSAPQAQRLGLAAPDGSPVDFYALLPSFGEHDIVHSAIHESAEILELGCGAGRMTHPLIDLGHPIACVDNSPGMLAHVRGADKICADIEGLDLGRSFPVVLLASHLVNTAEERQRRAFLEACARHIEPGGSILIQRADPSRGWEEGAESESIVHGVRIHTRVLSRRGTVIAAEGRYTIGERTWTHAYRSEILDDDAFERALELSALTLASWLDESRTWARAVTAESDKDR